MFPVNVLVVLTMILSMTSLPAQGSPMEVVEPEGALKDHLTDKYKEDWPHYAPWVHSEIKVADDIKAYSLRAIDLGYNILPGVPARGALVAYAYSTDKKMGIGLAFVTRTGELFKLYEVPAEIPKYREGIDLDYIIEEKKEGIVLIAWGARNILYLLKVKLGFHRPFEGVTFPVVEEVSNIIPIRLPWGYTDVRQVKVLGLDDEFAVFFTARREDKPTEEYGYDLFYALVDTDGTVKVGPKDFGFQDVAAFQVKPLNGPYLIGLAFMGRWRQENSGIWWATMRLENDSMKLVQIILISDNDFEVPEVKRILLDFDFCPINNNEYSVLVVWNDGRYKDLISRIQNIMKKINDEYNNNNINIDVEPRVTRDVWIIYGQRIKVDGNGICYKIGNNFPVMYLLIGFNVILVKQTRHNIIYIGPWEYYEELFVFGEIDSITVYTARGEDGEYFVVDASINVSPYLDKWLEFAQSGRSALHKEDLNYGYDIISVPIPVNPDSNGELVTEVDIYDYVEILPGILYPLIVAYPVYIKDKRETISPIYYFEDIIPLKLPLSCFIYLYDTIQFGRTPLVNPDQIDVKVVSLKDGSAIEGFIEKGTLFVMPMVPVAGLVKDIYKEYDVKIIVENKELYPLTEELYKAKPLTVLKFRPIRTIDHPGGRSGPVTYDLKSEQSKLKEVYVEVSYTTDFRSGVPPGPVLIEILGPAPSERPAPGTLISGYVIISTSLKYSENVVGADMITSNEETQVHVKFLPPAVTVLEKMTRTLSENHIDMEAIHKAANDALNELNKYLNQNLLQLPVGGIPDEVRIIKQTLEDLAQNENMKYEDLIMKLDIVVRVLKRLVDGTYHVFVIYHPTGSVQKYPGFVEKEKDLKQLFDELDYAGVVSWIPIDVKCEVPSVILLEITTTPTGVKGITTPLVLPPLKEQEKNSGNNEKNSEQESAKPPEQRLLTQSTPGRTSSPVPLLPVIPYRRGLSRPRLRRRSCIRSAC
ncbi:hypothetical protein [Methanopyrus sp. KOL6]|uniref:hypothetical protein n=1 Tax=Methanopyrus sp. KOL6 TaxID=1937004 RepID=UPI000B4A7347|nr:hypothetical protein [Methanopyrus sp. KOL6]